jgi:dinuclear metal center YbgI/SA1388 family protein
MIPKLRNILDLLEEIAPARLAEPWDNPGLQVGSYSQKIKKIFVGLDATPESLQSTYKRNAQLLLTHHPLIFKPISRFDIDTFPGNIILEAGKRGISIVAAHTNLDVAREGINYILADLLGLQRVEVLQEMNGFEGAGLGRIGDLRKSNTLSEVLKKLKGILGAEKLRVVGRADLNISRIAVVGGSGASLLSLASQKGADMLLTGDVGYHHAMEAESLGIVLIDGGHFHTEKAAFRIFAKRLEKMIRDRGWDSKVEVNDDEYDPVRYS